ncbi:hypothetical protein N9K17_04980 [Burkholderiaceae bacterium]|nr:hypothetical protein [Burkholderiaceae bacterium]
MTTSLLRFATLIWFCTLSLQATANEVVYLECTLEKTYDLQENRTSATTGSHLIVINVLADKKIKLKKQGLGPQFLGIGDETRFFAEASYVISGISFEETIDINRYTGSYENTFSTPKGGGAVAFWNLHTSTEKILM